MYPTPVEAARDLIKTMRESLDDTAKSSAAEGVMRELVKLDIEMLEYLAGRFELSVSWHAPEGRDVEEGER